MGQSLVKAVKLGDVSAVTKQLAHLKGRGEISDASTISAYDLNGKTPLHWAAKYGHTAVCLYFFQFF